MLKLSWLGSPLTDIDGVQVHFETRKVSALLAYLSLSSKANPREKLATLFWADSDQAHALANLRRALGSLTHCLPPGYVQADHQTIKWNENAAVHIDVKEFQAAIHNARSHKHDVIVSCAACAKSLEAAASLYQGDFLDGLNLPDCPDFDDWQYFLREELRRDLAWALEQLTFYWSTQAVWDKAARSARQWLALDSLAANARLALIDIYIHSGRRSLAQTQFEEYVRLTKEELGEEPDRDTLMLFQQHLNLAPPLPKAPKSGMDITAQGPLTLLKSKLYLPSLKTNRISRTRLLSSLDEITGHKLTLISAPAGFGKTSLLADWVAQSSNLVGWLSLDKGDNDPVSFFTYICAAIDSTVEGACANTQATLESGQLLEVRSYMMILLNDLEKISQPLILILDDFQFIANRSIHEACTYLLERAPANLHLVIASRADPPLPLPRLRAQAELLEIRTDDLRFTLSESKTFLHQVMQLDLSARDIQSLAGRTEGWAVGLQMAALSLRERKDVSSFIKNFSGTNRYILDYLLEEVLASQPAEIQQFLLLTSILERLTDQLCNAMMAIVDTSAEESAGQAFSDEYHTTGPSASMLERLERANLFLVPLDDERVWYRYHHLFADLLRARLSQLHPGLLPKLHTRAAAWLEQNGLTIDAITHYLAAGEYSRAAHLVEENTTRLLAQGEVNALMSWIEVLPAELRLARPRLCIHQAYVLIMGGRVSEVPPLLVQVEAILGEHAAQPTHHLADSAVEIQLHQGNDTEKITDAERRSLTGSVATIRSMAAALLAQNDEAISYAKQARQLLPPENLWDRTAAGWALGFALHNRGNLPEARTVFEEQIRLGQAMSNIATVMIALPDLSWLLRDQGRIRQGRALLENALAEASRKGARTLGFIARTKATLAAFLYEQNELEAAHTLLLDALDLARFWPNPSHLPFTYVFLGRVLFARGDLHGAWWYIVEAGRMIKAPGLTKMIRRLVEENVARVWLDLHATGLSFDVDDVLAAEVGEIVASWRNEIADLPGKEAVCLDDASEAAALTLAREAILAGRDEEALSLLGQLTQFTRTAGHINRLVGALVLSAITKQARTIPQCNSAVIENRHEYVPAALVDLEEALDLAEAGGYVRVFLDEGKPMQILLVQWLAQAGAGPVRDYASQLLTLFDAEPNQMALPLQKARKTGDLVEPLTPRELDVLQLICEGDSNQVIADKLVITIKTVKKHTGNILGKLGVASRAQAIVKAQHLVFRPKDK